LCPCGGGAPHLGRLFTEKDARDGADRVVLLGHGAWTRRFASDPDIVGTPVVLDDDPHTVVGVLPEGFQFPNPGIEFWTPFVIPPFTPPRMEGPAEQRIAVLLSFGALGRLRPGVSPEQAATEARTILQRSSDELIARAGSPGGGNGGAGNASADRPPRDGPEIDVRVAPLLEEMVGAYRPALLALTVATALVLLIACINVAGLLLARGVTRRRTLALSAALGAGRNRLVRQLLTESVALSVCGGVLAWPRRAWSCAACPHSFPATSRASTRCRSTAWCLRSPPGCRSSSGCCSAPPRRSSGRGSIWCAP
ncbi:MAG: ABC transporter permease, partial [Acidobacteria bacterium]|nr:ABC transporter permease [Acidobacteriota bacterium]